MNVMNAVPQRMDTTNRAPVIRTGPRSTTVKHREYVYDLNGSTSFSATSIPINPGLIASFPWLGKFANNFESYRIKKFHVLFQSAKSTSTSGEVMLAIDYDAADATPSSKNELMNMADAVIGAVTPRFGEGEKNVSRAFDLRKMVAERYNRSAALASNLDIKTYDAGNVIIATNACADTTYLGSILFDYEIELITPQLSPLGAGPQAIYGVAGTATSSLMGTTPSVVGTRYFSATLNTLTALVAGTFAIFSSVSAATSSGVITTSGTGTVSGFAVTSAAGGVSTYTTLIQELTVTVGQTYILASTQVGAWGASNVYIVPVSPLI